MAWWVLIQEKVKIRFPEINFIFSEMVPTTISVPIFLSQNFSKHRKVFSSCGNSKWMKRERKMIKGIQVDDWFIAFKEFFLPGYWFCCFLTCFLVILYSLSYGSIPGDKCECTSSKCQQWKLVSKWGKNHQRNLWSLGQRQKTHQYCTNRTAGTLIEKIKLQVRK